MDYLVSSSPFIRLGLTLLGIVILMRAKAPMGLSLVAGGGILAFLFSMPAGSFAVALGKGLFSVDTLFLFSIIVGIFVFSDILKEVGQIARIINAFKAMVGTSRLTLITFPALIGLLPMPGGAIFSAPMVGASVEGSNVTPTTKTLSNYWFRHIWEYWFPLYPGVALALALSGVPVLQYILIQLPMTAWSVFIGYLIILRTVQLHGAGQRNYSRQNLARFLMELVPIFIVVGAVALLAYPAKPLISMLQVKSSVVTQMLIIIGLIGGTVWLFLFRGLDKYTLVRGCFSRKALNMAVMALGIRIFMSVLERSGAVPAIQQEFAASGMSLALVVAALPFVAGLAAGIAVGFVGTSFPLVVELLQVLPEEQRLPYYALAYVMGYVGMMLSPVHICLLLTNSYFKSHLGRVYGYLFALLVPTAVAGVGLFWVYRVFL